MSWRRREESTFQEEEEEEEESTPLVLTVTIGSTVTALIRVIVANQVINEALSTYLSCRESGLIKDKGGEQKEIHS